MLKDSDIIAARAANADTLKIVGAMYDVVDGKVTITHEYNPETNKIDIVETL
jgi:carbonic anhydrase